MSLLKVPKTYPVATFILVGIFFWLLSSSMSSSTSPRYSAAAATTYEAQLAVSVVVGTRIHRKNAQPGAEINLTPLRELASLAEGYSDLFIVAVDGEDPELERKVRELFSGSDRVRVVPVTLWTFTRSLNSILTLAAQLKASQLIFQSVEVRVTRPQVDSLRQHLTTGVMVVGLAFEDHKFSLGEHPLDGSNVPWNTLAVWEVRMLALVGFLPVSDGLGEGIEAGVEEVVTISLLQQLRPEDSGAILLKVEDKEAPSSWPTEWTDPARLAWHQKKMASKVSRPATQMGALHLRYGKVQHLQATIPPGPLA